MLDCEWSPEIELPEIFFDLPPQVYERDGNWIPENPEELARSFSLENPYFKQNDAYLYTNDQTRLVGFFNPQLRIEGKRVAFFGYWETIRNLDANKIAFSKIEEWARSKGAEQIYGPINFSTFGNYRLRIDSFDHPQFLGEPYNPEYYIELLDKLGFKIKYKYFTACCTVNTLAKNAEQQLPKLDKIAHDAGIKLAQLTPEFWLDNLHQLYPIADAVFSENFAYSPISFDAFVSQCGESFANKFCPEMSNIALKNEKIVGFHLFYPDYSPIITQASESPVPIHQLNYSKHLKLLPEPRTFLGKTVGVLPEYRSLGLFYYLGFHGTMNARGLYDFGYGAMVREDNRSGAIKRFSMHSYQYALFTKELNA